MVSGRRTQSSGAWRRSCTSTARCLVFRSPVASSRRSSTTCRERREQRREQACSAIMTTVPARYDFLLDTYRTERLKTLNLWSQVPDERIDDRIEPRARSPREHMVHQSLSEDGWMRSMFGISVSHPVLPANENRLSFIECYA